jgi:GTP pyrophosphokinase
MPTEKRKRIAEETLEIYAPLAGRMGIQEMREELEDLSFPNLNPEAYDTISRRLADLSAKSERLVDEIGGTHGTPRLQGPRGEREGAPEAALLHLAQDGEEVGGLRAALDIFGFRIIVDSVDACYQSLGVVHTTWAHGAGPLQGLHLDPEAERLPFHPHHGDRPGLQRVELQIRTRDMDEIAEFGIAAHALYKEGIHGNSALANESRAYQWLRRTIDLLAEGDSPEEFLEHTKLELFHDQVFCFTPKGRLIALPAARRRSTLPTRSTPTSATWRWAARSTAAWPRSSPNCRTATRSRSCGPRARPARGLGIPRGHRQGPRRDPAGHPGCGAPAVCGARAPDPGAGLRAGGPGLRGREAEGGPPRLARASIEDVLAAVGRARCSRATWCAGSTRLQGRPAPSRRGRLGRRLGGALPGGGLKVRLLEDGEADAIPIRGLDADLPVRLAPDGGAVPGDRIVGILTPGEGVTIYPIQSTALAAFDNEPDRWLDVRWDIDPQAPQRFPARLALQSINEPGTLAQIAQVIADHDGNIDNVSMKRRTQDFTDTTIDLSVWDLAHLNAIVAELRAKRVVSRVNRVTG